MKQDSFYVSAWNSVSRKVERVWEEDIDGVVLLGETNGSVRTMGRVDYVPYRGSGNNWGDFLMGNMDAFAYEWGDKASSPTVSGRAKIAYFPDNHKALVLIMPDSYMTSIDVMERDINTQH